MAPGIPLNGTGIGWNGYHLAASLASFSHHSHEKHLTKVYNECVKFSKGYVECVMQVM